MKVIGWIYKAVRIVFLNCYFHTKNQYLLNLTEAIGISGMVSPVLLLGLSFVSRHVD